MNSSFQRCIYEKHWFWRDKDKQCRTTEYKNVRQLTFLKYKGASLAISLGTGMHSTMQCLRCCANPITVSRNTTSLSCFANIIMRHFLKFRISPHTLSSTVLVADSCCQIKDKKLQIRDYEINILSPLWYKSTDRILVHPLKI